MHSIPLVLAFPCHFGYILTMVTDSNNHEHTMQQQQTRSQARREQVEGHKWSAETDYQEGWALAQLSPGPLAAQLAMYLGYVRYRILGRRTITDIPTLVLALVTVALLWRWKKTSEPFIVLGAAVIGLVVYSALHR